MCKANFRALVFAIMRFQCTVWSYKVDDGPTFFPIWMYFYYAIFCNSICHKRIITELNVPSLCPRHKDIWGSGVMARLVLILGTRYSWIFSSTPRSLYPCKILHRSPLNRRLGGFQSRSACPREKKSLFLLLRVKTRFLGCATSFLVTLLHLQSLHVS